MAVGAAGTATEATTRATEQAAAEAVTWFSAVGPLDQWPQQADLLQWASAMHGGTAALLAVFGILYLAFGYYVFKYLVTLNAVVLGIWAGVFLGQRMGHALPAGIVGGLLAAALTWPLLKYAIAVLGGVFGFMLGVTVWNAAGYDPAYGTAGGLIGLVTLGMLSFVLFRSSVVLFMSIQGSVMLVFGAIGLATKYESIGTPLMDTLAAQHFVLPISLLVPLVFGLLYQSSMVRAEAAAKAKEKK